MSEPRTIRPMDGDKLDGLSRPPVVIPSFSKLPVASQAPPLAPMIAVQKRPPGRPPKAAPEKDCDIAGAIAALKRKRDRIDVAIAALEELE